MDASRVYLAKFGKSRLYVLIMPSRNLKRIETLKLPACLGTPFWKKTRYLKFKRLQRDSNAQPLSS